MRAEAAMKGYVVTVSAVAVVSSSLALATTQAQGPASPPPWAAPPRVARAPSPTWIRPGKTVSARPRTT